MRQDLLKSNITWKYNNFSENYGKIGKIYDFIKMFFFSLIIVLTIKIQIIHCRSHIPAIVGFFFKKIFKIKLVLIFEVFGSKKDLITISGIKKIFYINFIIVFLKN